MTLHPKLHFLVVFTVLTAIAWSLLSVVPTEIGEPNVFLLAYHVPNAHPDFYTQMDGAIDCPAEAMTIMFVGQSNAGNHLTSHTENNENTQIAQAFGGKCFPLSDPMRGATGVAGSLATILGKKLYQRDQKPLIMLSSGVGGASVGDWLPGSPIPNMRLALSNARSAKGHIDYIIWHQGETDALHETSWQSYADSLNVVLDTLQDQLPGQQRILVFGASVCLNTPMGDRTIVSAQRYVAQTRDDTEFVFNSDMLGLEYRSGGDKCHFNQAGAEAVVGELLPHIRLGR